MRKALEVYAGCRGDAFGHEDKDCVVRAFTLAANRPYAEIHALCKANGREDRKGTYWYTVERVSKALGMVKVDTWNGRSGRYMTLTQFIKAHPVGRYYLNKRGHAFALIDGVAHDWRSTSGPRTQIITAFAMGH